MAFLRRCGEKARTSVQPGKSAEKFPVHAPSGFCALFWAAMALGGEAKRLSGRVRECEDSSR